MGINRSRIRVGRPVRYFATDAEVATASVDEGDVWPATIVKTHPTTVDLLVQRGNGVALAKLGVKFGGTKGTCTLRGAPAP